jgi:Zn-dependent peptidase ImmA (M78 family)
MNSFMNPTQFRLIEEGAENLLAQYGGNFNPINTPPVPVEMIAERTLNLHCIVTDMLRSDVLGVLLSDGKQILVNQNCSKSQYFFTIAHEIGHWCLHLSDNPNEKFVDTIQTISSLMRSAGLKGKSRRASQQEIEANRFAASLLIPQSLLNPIVANQQIINASIIYELANSFQTSALTMLYRITYIRKNNELVGLRLDWSSLEALENMERRSYQL